MTVHHIAPSVPLASLTLRTALINGHPFVNVQDSKHGAKTSRNQILSGARLLSISCQVVLYSQLYEIAHEEGGPLMVQDVERLDRQDDRAAARLLSSAVLAHLALQHPEWIGLGSYLFVMGGLFEAWQNRTIGHEERLRLVFRACYFLVIWREHVNRHPYHTHSIHFLSQESFDILTIICESFIKLLRSYCDLYPDHPFVPWLHSTEPNEHLYGVARMIKTDFTYLDFIQLVPKMGAIYLGAFGHSLAEAKSNVTTSGYQHTYFKCDNINLKALCQFPCDDTISLLAITGWLEAMQLLKACGLHDPDSYAPTSPTSFEIDEDSVDFLVNEEVPVKLFRQSALLSMIRDVENEAASGDATALFSPEESREIQKLSYSQLGSTLGSGQEM